MSEEIFPAGTDLAFGKAPFPFLRVPGRNAMATLERLSVVHQDQTPIIWGDEGDAARLFECHADPGQDIESAESILKKLKGRSAAQLQDQYLSEVRDRVSQFYRRLGKPDPYEADGSSEEDEAPRGPWPDNIEPHTHPLSLIDYQTRDFKKEVLIGLIPTAHPWQAAAYLTFGNWNECPPPEVHVAHARAWFDAHGARPVLNSADTIEFFVERPIRSRDEALEMAQVHFRYCGDTVHQGAGTVDALAAHLLDARYWYFWWD